MSHMGLRDRIVLYAMGLLLYGTVSPTPVSIVPILLSIIGLGWVTYLEETPMGTVIGLAYGVGCWFYPPIGYFVGPILYGMDQGEQPPWRLLVLLPVVIRAFQAPGAWIGVILLSLTGVLLRRRTLDINRLQLDHRNLEDTLRGTRYQAQRQNQVLLEKQDDEIHVATLNERNRIAREIHDNVGHQLSSALLQVGALQTLQPDSSGLAGLKKTLDEAMDNIRSSVHNLYEQSMDLDVQMKTLVEGFQFCPIRLTMDVAGPMDGKIKFAVLAIVKEAFSNIIKHSNASQVEVVLMEHPGFYQLTVADNGQLTAHAQAQAQALDEGMGLKNIQQRVDGLKGHFLIKRDRGFTLFITLPKEEPHERSDH